jgi:hypothetical protein
LLNPRIRAVERLRHRLQPKEFDQADPDSREYGAQIRRQEIRLARRDVAAVTAMGADDDQGPSCSMPILPSGVERKDRRMAYP